MRVFLQVAQQESFDKVAQKNYVSQRAVSQLVKRLENEVNVKLFFRRVIVYRSHQQVSSLRKS
ncbi:helix-turn-helix domain-containing protein [Lactiplantibacillus plantarum]|uniref:helix-turn-helix domain-containing protein n=1 Tax=Lactiplantibacillus plantarum TaxID=1590 RepID=UPI0038790423